MSEGASSARRRGLGMGLSALLGAEPVTALGGNDGLERVPIEFLVPSPFQPRRHFDPAELQALAESIRSKGVLQPLVVRARPGNTPGYEIIAGERRWRAAQQAGLHELPVIVRKLRDRDALEIALIENLQREDLSAIEEADAYQRLMAELGHTQETMAQSIGKSRSHVANTLRLLKLPQAVRAMVADGRLSAGHARALLAADEPERLAQAIVERGLSVREVEALIRSGARVARVVERRSAVSKDPDLAACERRLAERLGLEVKIKPQRTGGSLVIRYRSGDQLEGILGKLSGTPD